MREYQKTHPWITFDLPGFPERWPFDLWLMLGEAQSKCAHVASVPLRPDIARELQQVYLAKGVAATTAIEGNTLTEEQVRKVAEGSLKLPPSKRYLEQEVENVIGLCNNLLGEIHGQGSLPPLDMKRIKGFNAAILKGLDVEDPVVPGEIRRHSVGIAAAHYRGAPPKDCEHLLERLCDWLKGPVFDGGETHRVAYALVQAVVAHLYIAWIHPFGDGNGRTARLVEHYLLLRAGVPVPSTQLLSNHYNLTRSEYYRQLDHASKSRQVEPFVRYAIVGFLDGIREQIATVLEQVLDVSWRNFVYEQFRDRKSLGDVRRRHLVMDLSRHTEPVPIEELRALSSRVAEAYARKTAKTLTRDVNALLKEGFLNESAFGFSANKDLIRRYLPLASRG